VSAVPPSKSVGAAAGVPEVRPASGRLIGGRYRLDDRLAAGGMAQVWRATDEVLQRQVAVKLLHPHLAADDTFVTRFRLEAVAAARLAHPGIVSIYDTVSDGGLEAIVMELLPGTTLRDLLDRPEPLDPWQVAAIAAQVADALDAAHRAGLVHRDIKPANILLTDHGRVKVADFGIAKAAAEADLTQPGLLVGTAKYVAPEQVSGQRVDPRTDVYSLGVVVYEALCGRLPFTGDTDSAVALARLHRDPLRPRQVRPSVPRSLEDVVCKAMSRDPGRRHGSAAELRAALIHAGAEVEAVPASDSTVAEHPDDPGMPLTRVGGDVAAPTFVQTERRWLVPTLLLVLVAVALGVAGLLLGRAAPLLEVGNPFGTATGGGRGATEVPIVEAAAFDPFGDQAENDHLAGNVLDGDPATAWATENYRDRDIARFKEQAAPAAPPGQGGVGLILTLDRTASLDRLEVTSPSNLWRTRLYVADAPHQEFSAWGEPVFTSTPIEPGQTSALDLKGTEGAAVLIWIIDRGEPLPGQGGRVELQDVRVLEE
jgi:eukaryotic-like serine/threonine-protein kinase